MAGFKPAQDLGLGGDHAGSNVLAVAHRARTLDVVVQRRAQMHGGRRGAVELEQQFEVGHVAHGGIIAAIGAATVPYHHRIHRKADKLVLARGQDAVGTLPHMAQVGEILGHDVQRGRDDGMSGEGSNGAFELLRLQAIIGVQNGDKGRGDLIERDIAGHGGAAANAAAGQEAYAGVANAIGGKQRFVIGPVIGDQPELPVRPALAEDAAQGAGEGCLGPEGRGDDGDGLVHGIPLRT